tara:strand:+ start:226 stop:825 length:600 start_codon:yes stop_codon:yes gene_type:complete
MFKRQKKLSLNLKILRLFFITPLLVSIPFSSFIGDAKASLEFQWDQNTPFKKLKWFQKEPVKSMRNKIYFFLRRYDRKAELLKIDLVVPKTFKSTLKTKNIRFCKAEVGGFEGRTKCLEDVPADIEIQSEDVEIKNKETTIRRILIYPYKPLPRSKDTYAIVLKAINPRRSGLYQFHSYVQYAGEESSRYLGSWTIVID